MAAPEVRRPLIDGQPALLPPDTAAAALPHSHTARAHTAAPKKHHSQTAEMAKGLFVHFRLVRYVGIVIQVSLFVNKAMEPDSVSVP